MPDVALQLHPGRKQMHLCASNQDRHLLTITVNEIMTANKHLLGHSSTRVLPGKQDIADGCPIAVDTQKSEGEGNL